MKPFVFGTSVQGALHIRSEMECQDSWKTVVCNDGTVIMAVADGHGSKNCPYSKTGSSIAVDVFCKVMSDYIERFADSLDLLLTYLNREGETKVAQEIEFEWKRRVEIEHEENKRDILINSKNEPDISLVYSQYGTTLLGLVLMQDFFFAFQIGDGDIVFTTQTVVEPVIQGNKILGVETHSLSAKEAWKKAITVVRRINIEETFPSMFLMSSDGFANSYKNGDEFDKTCSEYLEMINQYGVEAVNENLETWLSETSALGCGDDITVLIAYFSPQKHADCSSDTEITIQENELLDTARHNSESADHFQNIDSQNEQDDGCK